jgi:hypothetical protein
MTMQSGFFVDALALYESSVGMILQNISADSNDPAAGVRKYEM